MFSPPKFVCRKFYKRQCLSKYGIGKCPNGSAVPDFKSMMIFFVDYPYLCRCICNCMEIEMHTNTAMIITLTFLRSHRLQMAIEENNTPLLLHTSIVP